MLSALLMLTTACDGTGDGVRERIHPWRHKPNNPRPRRISPYPRPKIEAPNSTDTYLRNDVSRLRKDTGGMHAHQRGGLFAPHFLQGLAAEISKQREEHRIKRGEDLETQYQEKVGVIESRYGKD